jgi:hypothetical protein
MAAAVAAPAHCTPCLHLRDPSARVCLLWGDAMLCTRAMPCRGLGGGGAHPWNAAATAFHGPRRGSGRETRRQGEVNHFGSRMHGTWWWPARGRWGGLGERHRSGLRRRRRSAKPARMPIAAASPELLVDHRGLSPLSHISTIDTFPVHSSIPLPRPCGRSASLSSLPHRPSARSSPQWGSVSAVKPSLNPPLHNHVLKRLRGDVARRPAHQAPGKAARGAAEEV